MQRESDLYLPIKAFFEGRGYVVKGEVGAADVVAQNPQGEMVVVELKLGFSLTLFHQAVDRLSLTDHVYIAVPRPTGKLGLRRLKSNIALSRRLGLGLLSVRERDGFVECHAAIGPYAPRKSKRKIAQLQSKFDRLRGDPNQGGATRHGIVTGYRQDALKCAAYLAHSGAEKGAVIARAANVPQATRIMRDNHYGWFERVEKGVYTLTSAGRRGLQDWRDDVDD